MRRKGAFLLVLFILFIVIYPVVPAFPRDVTGQMAADQYIYHSYDEMTDSLQELAADFPEVMHLDSLGTTYEGRQIWVVELSNHAEKKTDTAPGVLLMGAHHGNEKPSYEILIYFIHHIVEYAFKQDTDDDYDGVLNEDIIDNYDNDGDGFIDEDPSEERIRQLLNETTIYVIPMVNPDGVEANTRKNREPNYGSFGFRSTISSYGVDLNRNYAFRWPLYFFFPLHYHFFYTMFDDGYNYRGEHPFSEKETSAVKDFVETHQIGLSLSYHTYGQVILFPWTHTSLGTPDEKLFISIGENISRLNGYYLYLGRRFIIPRFGGTLGTSENWLYGTQNILAFTIELCATRAPVNASVVYDVILKHIGVNLYAAERVVRLVDERDLCQMSS